MSEQQWTMTRQQWVMLHQLILAVAGALCAVSGDGTPGVNLNDPSQNSAEFWRDYYARLRKLQQPLDNNTSVDLAVQAGQTAALSCPVRNLGTRPVSWIRRRDFHVISSRAAVFSGDARFSVRHHLDGDEDWTLAVQPAVADDTGVYECQVSTGRGTLSRFVNLTVVVPTARVVGASVYRIEKGSVITLLCIIDGAIAAVPGVRWLHDNRTVTDGGRVRLETSTRLTDGGPRSQLHVRHVTFLDSGVYSCGGEHLRSASVQVFVTEGDKTAAIQRRSTAARRSARLLPMLLTLLLVR